MDEEIWTIPSAEFSEVILPPDDDLTEEDSVSTSSPYMTYEQADEIISLLTKVSERDNTELIASVGERVDIVVEELHLQSQLETYTTGFLLFFCIIALCTYVYKFFRLFF